jgi:hypothetical protein
MQKLDTVLTRSSVKIAELNLYIISMKLTFPNGNLLDTGSVFSFRALSAIALKGPICIVYAYRFVK